jgi:hypothetical protein
LGGGVSGANRRDAQWPGHVTGCPGRGAPRGCFIRSSGYWRRAGTLGCGWKGQIALAESYIPNRFHTRGLLIVLMMEAARTSETLANFYQTTRCYNPEDSHLRTHRRENLKSYLVKVCLLQICHQEMGPSHSLINTVCIYLIDLNSTCLYGIRHRMKEK